jgi:hypothetical protein
MDGWTDRQTDEHTRFSAETLNPKPGHTQEDTHYTEWYLDIEGYPVTEWYPLQTHPRGYPLHWVIPIIKLSDSDTLSDFSSHWQFSQPTQEFTHYTEGPCFPHKQTRHWVIPMTLRDTPDTEWYPLPWVPTNRIPDGRTDTHDLHWKKTQFFYISRLGLYWWWTWWSRGIGKMKMICAIGVFPSS